MYITRVAAVRLNIDGWAKWMGANDDDDEAFI